MSYPDYLPYGAICQMEGHRGNGYCPDCGNVNYKLLGYYGAVARWAKAWGITREQAEQRMTEHAITKGQALEAEK